MQNWNFVTDLLTEPVTYLTERLRYCLVASRCGTDGCIWNNWCQITHWLAKYSIAGWIGNRARLLGEQISASHFAAETLLWRALCFSNSSLRTTLWILGCAGLSLNRTILLAGISNSSAMSFNKRSNFSFPWSIPFLPSIRTTARTK